MKETAIKLPLIPTASLLLALFVGDGRAQDGVSKYAGADLASLSTVPPWSDAELKEYGGSANPAATDDGWHFEVTPFLWCASVDSSARIGPISTTASPSFNDILSNLDLTAMGHLEAGKGKWVFFSDLMYLDLRSDDNSGPVGISSVDVRLQEFFGSLNAGYRFLDVPVDPAQPEGPRFTLEGYAGVRYTWMEGTLNPFNFPTETESVDWWDPLVGLRGRLAVTSRLDFVGRWDFGGWGVGAEHTWFLFGGVNWRAWDSVSVGAGYAALYQDYYGSNNFHMATTIQGPVISLTFVF